MTEEELDAIPIHKYFTQVEKVIDGKTVMVPVCTGCQTLYTEESEPFTVRDKNGQWWLLVSVQGVKHRVIANF